MKFLFKLFFLLIALALIAGTIFLWLFDVNKYRDTITNELTSVLNRPVQMDKIELKLSLFPTIRLVNVTVGNQAGFDATPPFAKVGNVEMTMALVPLLMDKKVQIRDIQLKNAELNLIKKNNENNYTFSADKKSASKSAAKPSVALANISMNNNPYLQNLRADMIGIDKLVVNYQENEKKEQVVIKNVLIQQLQALSMLIEYKAIPMQFTANMNLLALIPKSNNFIFNTQLKVMDVTTKISGNIGDMKALKNVLLNIDIFTENLSNAASQAGTSIPVPVKNISFSSILKGDINKINVESLKLTLGEEVEVKLKGKLSDLQSNPQSNVTGSMTIKEASILTMLGVKPMSVTFDMSTNKNNFNINNLMISAGRSELSSVFKINWTEKNVNVIGNVSSNFFDIRDLYESPFVPENEAKSKTAQKKETTQPVAQKENNPLESSFNKLNVQIDWNIKNMKLLENVDDYYGLTGRTVFKNNALTINPMRIRTVLGMIDMAMRVNNVFAAAPEIQVSFAGDNIDLDKIKELHKYVNGSTANISGKLTTSGLDKQTLLSHLNGTVEVEVTQGKIVDKWFNELPTLIGLVSKQKSFSYSKTDTESALNCAVMNVKLNNGVAQLDKSVAIETSALDVVLSGQVNLPQETMSLSLSPSLPQHPQNQLMNAARMIRIDGSFNKPSMRLDTEKVITTGIQKGIDKGIEKLIDKMDKAMGTKQSAETSQSEEVSVTSIADEEPVAMREPMSLCAAALGHKLKGKKSFDIQPAVKAQMKPIEVPVQKKEEQLSAQEILKRQLIRSLTSAVQ